MAGPTVRDAIANSVAYRVTRRALQKRFIRKKPNIRERLLLHNATVSWVRAQMAADDPNATPDMRVKLNAAARHAHELLVEIAAERGLPEHRVYGALAHEVRP